MGVAIILLLEVRGNQRNAFEVTRVRMHNLKNNLNSWDELRVDGGASLRLSFSLNPGSVTDVCDYV